VKVKKGDTVLVIAGKDRGVKGKVLAVSPETGKVIVEGVNRVQKHEKITRPAGAPRPVASPTRKPASTSAT
jgi:large subunit ribosomal protein L24